MHNLDWYININPEIKDFSQSLPRDLFNIFMSLRDIILINLPFVSEVMINDIPTYQIANKKILYLICYSDKVVLGFYQGSKISDIHSLFCSNYARGTREIYFYSVKDTFNTKLIPYLQETMKLLSPAEKSTQIQFHNFV